jgi:hypothetical protein
VTLKCIQIPALANGYIDRELNLRDRVGVAVHLASCGNCRTYVRGLKLTRDVISQSVRAEVPNTLLNAVGISRGNDGKPS